MQPEHYIACMPIVILKFLGANAMLVHETIRIMNMCYYRFLKLVAVPCVTIAMAYEFWHSFDLKCLHYEIINDSYNCMSHISHT